MGNSNELCSPRNARTEIILAIAILIGAIARLLNVLVGGDAERVA
ncbi:hypothetical protein [Coleofasciculus chthonoplastes]